MMEWNNEGELLCLAGHYPTIASTNAVHYANVLQFYNSRGVLRFRIAVPYTQVRPSLHWQLLGNLPNQFPSIPFVFCFCFCFQRRR